MNRIDNDGMLHRGPRSTGAAYRRHGFRPSIMLATVALSLVSQPLPAQNLTPVGSIHGMVVAQVPDPHGPVDISLPNVTVTVSDAATGTVRGQAVTTLTGAFASGLLPAGIYRVCSEVKGFAQACSESTQIATDSVALRQFLTLRPQAGVLHGHVALQDGSAAMRIAAAQGTSAGAAQVSLLNGDQVVAGPVSVNASSDYVLAPVTAGSNLNLSVRYEAVTSSQPLALSQSDLDSGIPANVVLNSASPRVVSVVMTQNGNPIARAAPGSTVVLNVQTQDTGPGPLHYSWSSNVAGLVTANAPSVTLTLPATQVTTVVFVEVTNGNGGVARGSITIPLTTASSAPAARDLMFTNNIGPGVGRVSCIVTNSCIPPHQGLFIDPTLLMSGACTSETTCETEAGLYYKAIGALDASANPTQTGTFEGWKSAYGFSADPTHPASGELRAIYYNNADLQFGRDMHCRSDSTRFLEWVACYVSNYGDGVSTFGSDPQTAIGRAESNTGRIATVAMYYSFYKLTRRGLPPQTDRVQFYIFSNQNKKNPSDINDGDLANFAPLDSEGNKALPGLCLTCHGGSYDGTAHLAQNSSFLAFDAPTYIFSTTNPSISETAQREAVRQLNQMVEPAAYARPTISQLIDGWYAWCGGVSKPSCYIDDTNHPFYPNTACTATADPSNTSCGWPATLGGINAQSFYQSVPRLYCRTCHVAQANFFNMDSFVDWATYAPTIKSLVLASQNTPPAANYMPFAQVPYNAFWLNTHAASALAAFLAASGP
jgi:hypothetical protein